MQEIILFLLLITAGALLFLVYKQLENEKKPKENDYIKLLIDSVRSDKSEISGKLEKLDEKLFDSISSSSKTLQNQFTQHKEIIMEVSSELAKIKETNKQVLNYSQKLESLENILSSPKKRGVVGEFYLEALLSNILPPKFYQMQYRFKNNEIVDAVIYFQDKIIPIDSKFSLEKFNLIEQENDPIRKKELIKKFNIDLKNRIDETSKYIRPEENTSDFAFMFIPAEGIYLNLLNYSNSKESLSSTDIITYAFKKHIIVVSPISFYAYLQTVLQGLKSLKIERSVKEIIEKIVLLSKDIEKYEESFTKLGKQLETTVKTYNTSSKRLKKIDKDIYKISDSKDENLLNPYVIEE